MAIDIASTLPSAPTQERWIEYSTDLECLHCGRFIVRLRRRDPDLPLLPASLYRLLHCRHCGGPPITGDTVHLLVDQPWPWTSAEKPKRGRPRNPFSKRNLREIRTARS
jgi:hypothetical protein